MCEPFIQNHQYNFIQKQADLLSSALRTNADRKVLESVKSSAESKIAELFPSCTDAQRQVLDAFSTLKAVEEFPKYLKELEPQLLPFPQITDKQIQKLFPKVKKLKLPDLSAIDARRVTYLSWIDIASNKLFIVYHMDGRFVGVEGRFTPINKKGFCFVCNRYEELVLFSAISKKRPANASSDYYKAVGNYLCMNGDECNKNVTDTAPLERFIETVIG